MIELEVIKNLAAAVAFPVGRSVAGWLQNALKDNKITPFELKQLGETVLRVGIISVAVFFGADSWGIDINVFGASATAFIIDVIVEAVKKAKVNNA